MSEWLHALEQRREMLHNAMNALDDADDQFLDHPQKHELEDAQDHIQIVLGKTEEELEVVEIDWQLIHSHTEDILDLLAKAADSMIHEGLAEWDDPETREYLAPTLDNEPTAIEDTRTYIDHAIDDWHRVRMSAEEVLEETGGY